VSITQGFSSKKFAGSDGSTVESDTSRTNAVLPELFKIVKRN
jgi:hypothetical protein